MAAPTDTEITVLLTAKSAELKAGMQSAADSVASANAQMTASAASMAAATSTSAKTAAESEEQAGARIKAMVAESIAVKKAQVVALQQSTDATRNNTFATSNWNAVTRAAAEVEGKKEEVSIAAAMATDTETAALEANTGAAVKNAAAHGAVNTVMMSGNATREYGALLDEALRHNYSRMIGTTAVLGNRLNLLKYAFSPLGVAILATAAALGGLVASAIMAEDRLSKLRNADLATADASGVTADVMNQTAMRIGETVGTIGRATDGMYALAMSGKFMGESLTTATQAAVDLAQLTGEKIGEAAKQVESLGDDPTKAVAKLNDQFHFLTGAQFEAIDALQRSGDTMGATALAAKDLEDDVHKAALQSAADANIFLKSWHGVENLFDELGQHINVALGGGGIQAQIDKLKASIAAMGSTSGGIGSFSKAAEERQLAALVATQNAENEQAKLNSAKDAAASKDIAAIQDLEHFQDTLKNVSRTTQELQQKTADLWAIYKVNPADQHLAGMKFDTAKMTISGPAWDDLKLHIQEKFDDHSFNIKLNVPALKAFTPKAMPSVAAAPPQISAQSIAQGDEQSAQTLLGAERVDSAMAHWKLVMGEMRANTAATFNDLTERFNQIGQSFDHVVFRVMRGQETWRMGFHKMGEEMLMDQIKHQTRSLAIFLADKAKELPFFQMIEEGKTHASIAGNSQQLSSQTSTLTSGLSAQGVAAESSITTNAAVGASGAAASVSSIPVVGWVSFAEVGALALAEILAYKSMVSAAGGWDRVPYDGAHAILHQDEMVLPAQIANPMRHLAEGGNMASGDTHMHISTMDSRSFGDFLKKNPHALTAAVKKASRMHLGV